MTSNSKQVREFIDSLLKPGDASSVLDIGCGRGEDLRRIGMLASDETRLVGVDASDSSIAEARRATKGDPRFSFRTHDVSGALPFGDAAFDRVLSVNLLECIPDTHRLLQEVHRVLMPEGVVVFAHWDWDSQLIDGADKNLVRKIVHTFGDWKQAWMADADAWMGRRLWRTFQASGLFEGQVHPYVLTNTRFEPGTYGYDSIESFRSLAKRGMLAPDEYDAFRQAIEDLAASDQYFYSITMFVYVGQKRRDPGSIDRSYR
jgi:ubiquinone/menaquinone biosynthesis C-methylase UbiE